VASSKSEELIEELRQVVLGESNLVDTVIPTIVFLVVNGVFGFQYAMWVSLLLAVVIGAIRWRRGQSLQFALGGIGSVLLAIVLSHIVGRRSATGCMDQPFRAPLATRLVLASAG